MNGVEGQGTPPARAARRQLAGRAARSTLWSVGSQVAQTALGLGGFWILSHHLGPTEYGLVGMASTATGMLGVFGEGGVVSALTRSREAGPVEQASAFWLSLAGAAAVGLLSALAAPLLGLYYGQPVVGWLGMALALTFLLAVPGRVPAALLARELRFEVIALAGLASSALALGLAWWAAVAGAGPWALVIQLLAAPTLNALLLVVARRFQATPRHAARATMRSLGGFSWRLSLFNFLVSTGRCGDVVLGGRLLGPAAPGLLGMAARLGNMPVQRLSSAVAGVFLPAAARLQGAERASAYASVLRLLLLLVGPFCAWMIAAAPEILSILPARWAGLEPIVRAIAAGSVLEPVGTLAWALVAASGRADLLLRFSAVFVPAAWLLSLAGALSGSATGLAVTWAVTNSLGAIGIALLMPRATGAPGLGLGLLAGPLVLSAALGLCVRAGVDAAGLVRSPSGLLLGLAIAGATYGLCLAAFYRGVLRRGIGLIARAP